MNARKVAEAAGARYERRVPGADELQSRRPDLGEIALVGRASLAPNKQQGPGYGDRLAARFIAADAREIVCPAATPNNHDARGRDLLNRRQCPYLMNFGETRTA